MKRTALTRELWYVRIEGRKLSVSAENYAKLKECVNRWKRPLTLVQAELIMADKTGHGIPNKLG